MCAMAQSSVCLDSFIYAPRLIHLCAMTHSSVYHDSFTRAHVIACSRVMTLISTRYSVRVSASFVHARQDSFFRVT